MSFYALNLPPSPHFCLFLVIVVRKNGDSVQTSSGKNCYPFQTLSGKKVTLFRSKPCQEQWLPNQIFIKNVLGTHFLLTRFGLRKGNLSFMTRYGMGNHFFLTRFGPRKNFYLLRLDRVTILS